MSPPGRPDRLLGVATLYKVVETSEVTDLRLEEILNEWTSQGWRLESMQFAMRDSSPRPAMAFVTFTRTDSERQPSSGNAT